MTKRLRQLLVALLMLTLPMQAFAAATMLRCAGDDHATWPELVATALSGGADAHSLDSPMHDDGSAHHEHARPDGAVHSHRGATSGDSQGRTQCNFCSDCCGGAAIHYAAFPVFAMAAVMSGPIASVAQVVSGRAPERLDRPPRSFLV